MKPFSNLTSASETLACRSKRGDDRHLWADDAADQTEQRALGVVVLGGEAGAVQHEIDAVEPAGPGQASLPLLHQAVEEALVDRAVRFGHRQQDWHRLPGAGRIHGGDEAGHLAQHARGGRSGLGDHVGAAESVRVRKSASVATGAKRLHSMEKPSRAMRGGRVTG